MEIKRNGSQPSRPGSVEYFSGQVRIDPLLGPLQDNGGPTLTQAPLPQSATSVASLKAAVTPATTTIPVNSTGPFIAGQFLLIDGEQMQVVGVNAVAGTLTVTRAVRGTTAAAHAAGAAVFLASPLIDTGDNAADLHITLVANLGGCV